MRFAGVWLCAVSALALSACHRPAKTAAHPPAEPQGAGPAAAGIAASGKPGSATTTQTTAAAGSPSPSASRSPAAGAAPSTGHARATSSAATPVKAASQAPARQSGVRSSATAEVGDSLAPVQSAARANPGFSAEYASCVTSASGFTVALANCRSAELARQGARVDRAFDAVLATRSGDARLRLVQDQHAWLGRRDAECQADIGRRRAADMLFEGSCRIDMTIKRATALEHMLG